jgi:ribonuclease Y
MDVEIKKAGEQAIAELGQERVDPELVRLLGRLKYRYSYAQNVWIHSVEVGFLCGMMAGELGLDVNLARRAGLLHDVGKAVDHEVEGGHAVIGGKICKRHGERPEVVNAVAGHHDDIPAEFIYTHLATAADALSGARPGARRETLASYVQRLDELERLASGFGGVDRSYALQAGREVRVMVEGSQINDIEAVKLSRDIARKIEDDMTYPGQIKVCVIRETRSVEFAK